MDDEVIRLDSIWKIFGGRAKEAMAAIQRDNLSKTQVLEEFGCVVGVADCSFSIERGEIFCVIALCSNLRREIANVADLECVKFSSCADLRSKFRDAR